MIWRALLGLRPRISDLARTLLKRARAEQPHIQWTYDSVEQTIRSKEQTIHLANIFTEYLQADAAGRPALIEKYSSMLNAGSLKPPTLWTIAAPNVFPAIRSRYDYMVIEISSRGDSTPPTRGVAWQWTDDLHVRLLYDYGPNMRHVQPEQLETWGQSEDSSRQQALRNLAALQRPKWNDLGEGLHKIQSDIAYEESFLLVDAVIRQLPFADHAVVMPPNRGVLLAADGRSQAALNAMLREAFRSLQERPWPITGTMLHHRDGQWRRFIASDNNELLAHAVESLNKYITYRDQQEALNKHFEKINEDVFVATFDLSQTSDDIATIFSWCTWTKGVLTLLPKADKVVFGKDFGTATERIVRVPWDAVVSICGSLLNETTEDPPRFRVSEFPTDEMWEQLESLGERLGR